MNRKLTVFCAVVVASALGFMSTAYACTVFRGTMTVTDPAGNSTFATGSNQSMSWCIKPQDNAAASAGGGAKGADGSSINVKIQPAPSTCGGHSPSSGSNYDINFYNGSAFTYTISSTTGKRVYSTWQVDCMSPRLSGVVNLGFGGVYSNGTTKSWNVNLPAVTNRNASGEASAVCFSDTNGNNGNQVPIIITG